MFYVRHAWGCSLRQEWRELREDFLEQVWEACFQALLKMSRSKTLTFKFQKLNNRFMGKCCTEPQEQGDSADLCCG